jgi:hypothetical protein
LIFFCLIRSIKIISMAILKLNRITIIKYNSSNDHYYLTEKLF